MVHCCVMKMLFQLGWKSGNGIEILFVDEFVDATKQTNGRYTFYVETRSFTSYSSNSSRFCLGTLYCISVLG